MLLMMAWLFWYFCGEDEKTREDSRSINYHKTNAPIESKGTSHTKFSRENEIILEEHIDASFIHLDESENYDISMDEVNLPSTFISERLFDFNYVNADVADEMDYEVSSAFSAVSDDEILRASLMKNRLSSIEGYQGKIVMPDSAAPTTKLTIHANENDDIASGRIHSIIVPNGEEAHHVRVRSVSPSVCIHPEHAVHNTHKGHKGFVEEEVSLVMENEVNSVNVSVSNYSPDSDEYLSRLTEVKPKQSPSMSKQNKMDTKPNPGKLKKKTQRVKVEELSNSPHAKLTDFEKVMRSRKLHTDTMDITANILGNLGHREEKIKGSGKQLSGNWAKLQDAVKKRQFLSFKDIPLSSDTTE